MLALLVWLCVLAIVVWVARAVLAGLGAPSWLLSVVIGIACIVAILAVASAFGIPVPSLR